VHVPRGLVRTEEARFFRRCVFEQSLGAMVRAGWLSPPTVVDAPVAAYDFSQLELRAGAAAYAQADVEAVLKDQARVTPGIVANLVELARERQGVMVFAASVRHAKEVLALLPAGVSALVTGETDGADRDAIIARFKARELKFLVNVSVLTTGFDAPHVDLIALLRPTESASLFQQIVGRGLRLCDGKTDCLVLDYTGQGHDLFHPDIQEDRPSPLAVPVTVACPECGHDNEFWGLVEHGEIVEHFGRRCQGAHLDGRSGAYVRCPFRFRYKTCGACGAENDTAARTCAACGAALVDDDRKLRDAMALKDAHVLRVDSMALERTYDRKGGERLEVRYYDADGQALKEWFRLSTPAEARAFRHNFLRLHLRRPEQLPAVASVQEALALHPALRVPAFVIARKREHWWQVREKVFR
jgi:DNA repair protein RadD